MNEVQQKALGQALNLLRAAGVQFAVLLPDGTKHGDLNIAPPETPRTRTVSHTFRRFGYLEVVRAMQAGESKAFPFPAELNGDKVACGGFASAISSAGINAFGAGNFITARMKDGSGIEALRVA